MDRNTKKQRVAEAVLDYIDNGESLGIGSGSTVNILIGNLSKVKSKIRNIVSSSVKSTELLESGITSIGRGNSPRISTFFESSTMQMN